VNAVRADSLVLEPQVAAHAAEMYAVLSDPAIYEFENSPPESQPTLERRFTLLESRVSPSGDEHWLNWVIRLPTGALAGYVQATVTRDGLANIAYELGSTFWRQGIGGTAVRAMLAELAATYGVQTAAATLKARNYRSLALLRSLDFVAEPPPSQPPLRREPDELVMYKPLLAENNAAGPQSERSS
jgi:[ribosomal protein S5]-alanine N-acetyltransferase